MVVAVVAVVRAVTGDGGGADSTEAAPWQRVVVQTTEGDVVVFNRSLEEQHRVEVDPLVLRRYPPVEGKVLLDGTQADVASAPVAAILDLATGDVEPIDLDAESDVDVLAPLAGTPIAVLGQASGGGPAFVVDIRTGAVTDLARAAGVDEPLILPSSVRATTSGSHVVFANLEEATTVLVDMTTSSATTLAGFPVDITDDLVMTVTNRGDGVLVDAYDLAGERIGTVETVLLAGGMLRDDGDALVVGRDGSIHRLDFGGEDDDRVGSLADRIRELRPDELDPDDAGDEPDPAEADVGAAFPAWGHRRLVALVGGRAAVVDADGELVGVVTIDRTRTVQLASSVRVDDRCIAVGTVEESALVDVESATEVFRADRILDIDRSADGCTVASGSHVRGPDTDVTIDGEVSGLSDDGSTVLASGSGGAMAIVDVESGERTPLAGVTGYGGDLLP